MGGGEGEDDKEEREGGRVGGEEESGRRGGEEESGGRGGEEESGGRGGEGRRRRRSYMFSFVHP